ncbi:MAG TPA: hypothetical protein VF813_00700, partial [Anaerolineaceae bacterium]
MREPWFRYYTETAEDPKLKRAARLVGCRRNVILATWATVMTLGKRSPTEGLLLLARGTPLTTPEIDDAAGNEDPAQTETILNAFATL